MAKNDGLSCAQICNAAKKKNFAPVYILMGEESYYIDHIESVIAENALTEDEKDFNMSVFYGLDTDIRNVISTCKRYPVMSQYQLVIVKEAQMMSDLDLLQHYIDKPLKSTILVVCNKNGSLKAPETMKIAKTSDNVVIYESNKITERNIGSIILDYVDEKKLKIPPKSVAMLRDFIGTDVSRLFGEIDKLSLILPSNSEITPEVIERNIGISKDYNNFELENAISVRDAQKALQIIDYFKKNPRSNPLVLTTGTLFSFFANLLLMHTSRDKTDMGYMKQIETKSSFRVGKLKGCLRMYSAASCFACIGYIREFDTKSKGIGSRQNEQDLFEELILKILRS